MKHYTATKTIQAEPMTAQQALEAGLIRENRKQHIIDAAIPDGYHTVYPDGYESWCPKDTFVHDYRLSETFLDRLHIEAAELQERINKLQAFINGSEVFADLGADDRGYLQTQLHIMTEYLNILNIRILRATKQINR